MSSIFRLDGIVRDYAWGSREFIARLQRRPVPTQTPEAELWLGAHPLAPAQIVESGKSPRPLDQAIASDPTHFVGSSDPGAALSYLLKVLAADAPLSLQAHPNPEQARSGFADEERRGVPRTAPHRNYKDPFAKPELICALTPFVALYGFRDPKRTAELLTALHVFELDSIRVALETEEESQALETAYTELMRWPRGGWSKLVAHIRTGAMRLGPPWQKERDVIVRVADKYPGDIGVACALLLNVIHLAPLEAIYLPAGNMHAYVSGAGVEIMGASDNVLRGGLTPKHVDVPELLRVLDFHALEPKAVAERARSASESVYDTPSDAFALSRVTAGTVPLEIEPFGPEILLVTDGQARITCDRATLLLRSGESAFVMANAGRYTVDGSGTVFRATVGGLPAMASVLNS